MRATRPILAAAALAAATLVLTGCEPVDTTGGPGTATGSGTGGDTCDPGGWGPLSGCDSADQEQRSPNGADGSDQDRKSAGTDTCDTDHRVSAVDTGDESRWSVFDTRRCPAQSHSDGPEAPHQGLKVTETTRNDYTVTVTWIVVDIKITGFRECVLDLRPAHPQPDDHFSRRFTTPKDCEAQRIDAVYRPVDH